MFVGALRLELHVPHSHSLKDKRAAVRPIVEGIRNRYACAAAEVDHLDQWQRAELGVAAVGGRPGHVADLLDAVERFVWSFPEIEVLECERSWLEEA
jgi:uncharacterized protein YlxP (DUF503 family)